LFSRFPGLCFYRAADGVRVDKMREAVIAPSAGGCYIDNSKIERKPKAGTLFSRLVTMREYLRC
jgi:hypothetical protein